MVSITLSGVTKRFGSVTALNNLDLQIEKGEMFFLLGSSGCGKTTLLRSIAGFYIPDSGNLYFDDEDVTHRAPHKRNTAMVFQSYALWPHMSVAQNVSFGLQQRGLPRGITEGRAKKALRLVQMQDYANRRINQLSGGQQQRVALARALVVEPACLLLDEPLSNLDAQLRLEMRTEIRRICKEAGLTTVYVTHDQKEALSVADRMAILDGGNIAQVGTPQEVYRNPVTRGIASFIGETNFLPGRLIEPARTHGYWAVETSSGIFEGRISHQNWKPRYNDRVVLSVRPEGWILTEAQPDMNFIRGRISGRTYLGETLQYELAVEEQSNPVRITEVNPRLLEAPTSRVFYAEASPEDVIILQS
ncbi:MAG: ABC transporter ATP-binding protein [Verrucomicrobiota bacterium]